MFCCSNYFILEIILESTVLFTVLFQLNFCLFLFRYWILFWFPLISVGFIYLSASDIRSSVIYLTNNDNRRGGEGGCGQNKHCLSCSCSHTNYLPLFRRRCCAFALLRIPYSVTRAIGTIASPLFVLQPLASTELLRLFPGKHWQTYWHRFVSAPTATEAAASASTETLAVALAAHWNEHSTQHTAAAAEAE